MTGGEQDDLTAARIRRLEGAGFPPKLAREIVARNSAETDSWPELSGEQKTRLRALLDLSDGVA